MKVLLADDDREQLELRGMLLSRSGFEIIEASDGPAALEAATEQSPECAVVDLRLPTEELGLWLIRALKTLDAAMRVIVLTGGDPRRFDLLPEKKLVDEVIVKGNSSAHLLASLRALAGAPQTGWQELRERLKKYGSLTVELKVIPRASKSQIIGLRSDGSLKVKVAAVPDKGKANEELIALLAEEFGVAKSAVELLSGETSQRKRVKIGRG